MAATMDRWGQFDANSEVAWFDTAWQSSPSRAAGQRIGEKTVDLTLETQVVEGATIVAVGGEIDVYTAPRLRDKITELVGDGIYDLIIDMEGVEFLDSTGLGVLVGGLKKVRAHDGSLQLICTQERLLKIFRITGLAKVFTIHDSAAAAVAG
jgi:anti-sigma B factor antagonist